MLSLNQQNEIDMKKRIFNWIFKDELKKLNQLIQTSQNQIQSNKDQAEGVKNLLGNIDVSVDVHHHSPSWAVISIQGNKSDYIKFIDLGHSEIREIQMFLRNFDRRKIDCSPLETKFFKV